jgi:hypothetical protein
LTALATTTHPTANVAGFRLFIDGALAAEHSGAGPATFTVDTAPLADGHHSLQITAFDTTTVRSEGRWLGSFVAANHGTSVSVSSNAADGDLSSQFVFDAVASGAPVELRLVASGRVVASARGNPASWTLLGNDLGAGPLLIRAEADYGDGPGARSAPVAVDVEFANPPSPSPGAAAPIAYGYRREFRADAPLLIELPASDADGSALTYSLLSAPVFSAITGTPPALLVRPLATGMCGEDTLVFQVTDGAQSSGAAVITLRYPVAPFLRAEVNGDGSVDLGDSIALLGYLFTGGSVSSQAAADVNGDGQINIGDPIYLLSYLFAGGPAPPPPFPAEACL